LAQARLLWDAVDDRFGEMVMDRIFWNQRLKQTLQSVMVGRAASRPTPPFRLARYFGTEELVTPHRTDAHFATLLQR
jgi:hypothetical protein